MDADSLSRVEVDSMGADSIFPVEDFDLQLVSMVQGLVPKWSLIVYSSRSIRKYTLLKEEKIQ
jgi:hypothetical protein